MNNEFPWSKDHPISDDEMEKLARGPGPGEVEDPELVAAIQEGIASIEAHGTVPYSRARIMAKARAMMARRRG